MQGSVSVRVTLHMRADVHHVRIGNGIPVRVRVSVRHLKRVRVALRSGTPACSCISAHARFDFASMFVLSVCCRI